ncbi:AbrB/MazE/SpoVT family DNA-binding domain-containing protein [Metallosphaera tengchongensis]|uniref:AbrB/MazE/SpoVT family DNA-binding domain-containing protein n=1 Tax=Metallosphaera tengchongensis TaxID=1532350 RepID=A0A6N0NW72_9CREN|nr:phosphate uptake regulator PhoU [Metallosphaera tengchongensis]QKQ99607.1 AbrB/MazE/SpoVT family DNA-binding domain-containing protein [Metallosphaera tengchongensis]
MQTRITRKIQLTGGSTYIISLPKVWVKELSLKPGDEVELIQDNNFRLLIVPRGIQQEPKQNRAIVSCENLRPTFAVREFIAYYMAGYNTVSLVCPKMKAEERGLVKDTVRKRLLGAEVIEEDAANLTVQFLVNEKDLPISRAINRAAIITQNMLKDTIDALRDGDVEIAREVQERDDEVDRFYFYVARQLTLSITSFEVLEEEGYNATQIVDIYSAIKSIERIADHASRISSLIPEIGNGTPQELLNFGDTVLEVYRESVKAFINGKREVANKIIDNDYELAERHRQTMSIIFKLNSDLKPSLLLVTDSFRRISRYSLDLAETTINLLAKTKVEDK